MTGANANDLFDREQDLIRNGQGPQSESLLLIGNGRWARHLSFYLQNQNIPFVSWKRQDGEAALQPLLSQASRVAVAISDKALPEFIAQIQSQTMGRIFHFSGALTVAGADCAHPLMSFGADLYSAEFYPKIHFTLSGADHLHELLPRLPNSFSKILSAEKALYHAECVMGGNFPVLLWNEMKRDLTRRGIPEAAVNLYIEQVCRNFLSAGEKALTGPLVRGDHETIQKNIKALQDSPWQAVYQSFVEAHR